MIISCQVPLCDAGRSHSLAGFWNWKPQHMLLFLTPKCRHLSTKHNFQRILKFSDSKPFLAHVQIRVKQSLYKSWGFQEVESPIFQDKWRMKVVRLSTLITCRLYPPPQENISGTYLWWRLSQTQGHSAAGRNMSMKYSNDTTRNRNRDFPACSSVPQPTVPQRVSLPKSA